MTAPAPRCQPTTEHAPTPWRVNGNAIWSDVGYVAELSCPRGPDARDADAAFIVEAVNSHASLTARVKDLLEIVEAIPGTPDEMPSEPCEELCCNSWCNEFGCISNKIRDARAALDPKGAAV
jgi:hypothetical protein